MSCPPDRHRWRLVFWTSQGTGPIRCLTCGLERPGGASCVMRQPVAPDGTDTGGPYLDGCPLPITHTDRAGVNVMCTPHARFHARLIGPTVRLVPGDRG